MRLLVLFLTICLIAKFGEGASVAGVVIDPADAEFPRLRVELRGAGNQVVQTDDLGRFRFDGVCVGRYTIWLRLAGFQTKVLQVEVSRPEEEIHLGRVMLGLDFGLREREVSEIAGTRSSLSVSFSVEGKASVSWSLICGSPSCGKDAYRGKDILNLRDLRPGRYRLRADAKGHYSEFDEYELTDGIGYSFGLYLNQCRDRRCDPADRGIMLE